MIAWIKSLFKTEGITLPNVSCTIPMPKVKPPKGTNISEPVLTLLDLWNVDRERFIFKYDQPYYTNGNGFSRNRLVNLDVKVSDKETSEELSFLIETNGKTSFIWQLEKEDYPIFQYKVLNYPNWLTQDEVVFMCKEAEKYFKPRVSRYVELKKYRYERKLASNLRSTELNKIKERQRLVNLYTKES